MNMGCRKDEGLTEILPVIPTSSEVSAIQAFHHCLLNGNE